MQAWMYRQVGDVRDVPLWKLTMKISLLFPPIAIALFAMEHVPLWLGLLYSIAQIAFFLGPFILMIHNVSHRPVFKSPAWNYWIHFGLGPLFGLTPYTYSAHHVGMHHKEENAFTDLSSTLPYQRDRLSQFGKYWLRFLFVGMIELSMYLWRNRRKAMLRRALFGEIAFVIAVIVLGIWKPSATIFVFLIPLGVSRFAMMAGNWAQHGFIDIRDPENPYKMTITCVETGYNRRCFNDGYHLAHHLKASMHWTEMPDDFERNRNRYAQEGSIVFRGVDFFTVWGALMLKRYRWLSRHMIVPDQSTMPKEEERVEFLRGRTTALAP